MLDEIIKIWIAPTITAIVAAILSLIIEQVVFKLNDNIKIKKVNNQMIEHIEPFIIQQIFIKLEDIKKIRSAIILENDIKEYKVYSIEELRDILILNVSNTKYLKEEEKNKLFKLINNIFTEKTIDEINNKNETINTEIDTIEVKSSIFDNAIIRLLIINLILIILIKIIPQ